MLEAASLRADVLHMSHDVSPELVLVDPALADHALSRLTDPQDTLARVDALVQTSRMASLARLGMEQPASRAPDVIQTARRISRIELPKSAMLAGATVAGMLVMALLVGVRVNLGGAPAGADTAATAEVAVPLVSQPNPGAKPQPGGSRAPRRPAVPLVPRAQNPGAKSRPRGGQAPRQPQPEPQRFAWAPAAGASAYHIELFRGSSKVFEADTKQPAITIPAQWRFGGRKRSLEPADYRWNVWPMFSGRRAARAIVQARLAIPAP